MLRLLILLECDLCSETWTTIPPSNHPLGIAWDEEIQNLQYRAEQNGWSINRSQQVCDACVLEAMFAQNSS